jgi:hypothetical protein
MTVAQANLVSWWKMDDNAASTVVLDSSGNGYNGTSVRDTSLMHVAGKIDGALNFDGSADYINTNQTFGSVFQNNFTISLWCKVFNKTEQIRYLISDGTNIYISIGEYTEDNGYLAAFYFSVDNHLSIADDSKNFVNYVKENWALITVAVEQIDTTHAKMDLYVNETLYGSDNEMIILSGYAGDNLFLGAYNTNPILPIDFPLDDIRIYNKALSADEVKQIYNENNIDQMRLNSTGENLFSNIGV